MNVKLTTIDPFSPPIDLEIKRLPIVIGKDRRTDVLVADRGVSERHCEIFEQDGKLSIRDLESQEGILVNGARVSAAVLQTGDIVTIGIRVFRVSFRSRKLATKPGERGKSVAGHS
jgi:pSer/pThr/pTyr-binding forkhead associated (FHA) protein